MLINFLGDSITQGACATESKYNYVNKVKEYLNCDVINYGLSGQRIARNHQPGPDDYDYMQRAPIMARNADFVFVFGGTNDWGHGNSEMGNIDSMMPYQFYGALNILCYYLVSVYGKEKVVFILPTHRFDEDNEYGHWGTMKTKRPPLKEYSKAIIEVCNKFGLDYMDLGDVLPRPENDQPSKYFQDGLHPNNLGHDIIAKEIVKFIKNKLNN